MFVEGNPYKDPGETPESKWKAATRRAYSINCPEMWKRGNHQANSDGRALWTAYTGAISMQRVTERLDRTIIINGQGSTTSSDYTIRVSGELEEEHNQIDGTPVSIGPNEGITGPGRAEGRVGRGRDGYRFSGSVESITLSNSNAAEVTVDGKPYDGGSGNGGDGDDGNEISDPPLPGGNRAPISSFSISPDPVTKNETVTFDASGARDPDGQIKAYKWSIVGPESESGSGEVFSATFTQPGNYTATLTVRDDDGGSNTKTKNFTVKPF